LFGHGYICISKAITNEKITELFKAIVTVEPKFESINEIIRKKFKLKNFFKKKG
jgi:hypothetical protein